MQNQLRAGQPADRPAIRNSLRLKTATNKQEHMYSDIFSEGFIMITSSFRRGGMLITNDVPFHAKIEMRHVIFKDTNSGENIEDGVYGHL